jgi:hypothetical protein
MASVGKNVDDTIQKIQRGLMGFERIHEIYNGSKDKLESFWTDYDSNYNRHVKEYIEFMDGYLNKTAKVHVFEDHKMIADDIKQKYNGFRDLVLPSPNMLKSALDACSNFFNGNSYLRTDNAPGSRSLNNIYDVDILTIMQAVKDVNEKAKVLKSACDGKITLPNDANFAPLSESEIDNVLQAAIAQSRQYNQAPPGTYFTGQHTYSIPIRQVVPPQQKKILDNIRQSLDVYAAIFQRLQDKTFVNFLNDFAKGSSSSQQMQQVFKSSILVKTKGEIGEAASIDGLYSSDVLKFLETFLEKAKKDLRDAVQPLLAKPDVSKKVQGQLAEVGKALDSVNPNAYDSPNHVSRRGTRFIWSDAKSRLDAFASVYGADGGLDKDGSIDKQGLLYRKPDYVRMRFYIKLVQDFRNSIDFTGSDAGGTAGSVVQHIESARKSCMDSTKKLIEGANNEIAKLETNEDAAYKSYATKRYAQQKKLIMLAYIKQAKSVIARYVQMHMDFALKRNRQGMRYMAYWKAASINNQGAKDLIDEYFNDLVVDPSRSIAAIGRRYVNTINSEFLQVFNDNKITEHMDDDDKLILDTRFDEFQEWVQDRERRVESIHDGPPGIFDVLSDSQIIMLYALKLIRFALLILSLAIARRAFTAMYNERVYESNGKPPHPAIMVGIFLGVESGFAVITAVILALLKSMFATSIGFPVDSYLISRWALDWVCATVVIAILSLIIGHVVSSRKYFRYRFEGERGIRALETLLRYLSGVVLLLPFYRMAD